MVPKSLLKKSHETNEAEDFKYQRFHKKKPKKGFDLRDYFEKMR